jgi:hypothetical protein
MINQVILDVLSANGKHDTALKLATLVHVTDRMVIPHMSPLVRMLLYG